MEKFFTDTSGLIVAKVEDIPAGTLVMIDQVQAVAFVFTTTDEDDFTTTHLLDLEGEEAFEIWNSEDVERHLAMSFSNMILEVDPTSGTKIDSFHGMAGHAFRSEGASGLIGRTQSRMGRTGHAEGISITGEVFNLTHGSGAFAYKRWRLCIRQNEETTVLLSHDTEAQAA